MRYTCLPLVIDYSADQQVALFAKKHNTMPTTSRREDDSKQAGFELYTSEEKL